MIFDSESDARMADDSTLTGVFSDKPIKLIMTKDAKFSFHMIDTDNQIVYNVTKNGVTVDRA